MTLLLFIVLSLLVSIVAGVAGALLGLGGGVMYALTPNSGVVGELKISYMLPTPNIVISPTVGYAMGF